MLKFFLAAGVVAQSVERLELRSPQKDATLFWHEFDSRQRHKAVGKNPSSAIYGARHGNKCAVWEKVEASKKYQVGGGA